MKNKTNPLPNMPTGPIHSFIALPYPLPKQCQDRLKDIQHLQEDAREGAWKTLDNQLRDFFGVEVVRRSFVGVGS